MKKIEFLFPEYTYNFGEKLNVHYIKRMTTEEVEIIETTHNDVPKFINEKIDMVYIGSLTEKAQLWAIEYLKNYSEQIKNKIKDGQLFLVTGNSIELFGTHIDDNGNITKCLGFYNYYSKRDMVRPRHNTQFYGKFNGMDIVGHRSQFSFIYGDFDNYFIDIKNGIGMNPETKLEGIKDNNFFATYSLGPFLIINPEFLKYIQKKMGLEPNIEFEDVVYNAFNARIVELKEKLK